MPTEKVTVTCQCGVKQRVKLGTQRPCAECGRKIVAFDVGLAKPQIEPTLIGAPTEVVEPESQRDLDSATNKYRELLSLGTAEFVARALAETKPRAWTAEDEQLRDRDGSLQQFEANATAGFCASCRSHVPAGEGCIVNLPTRNRRLERRIHCRICGPKVHRAVMDDTWAALLVSLILIIISFIAILAGYR